MGYVYSYSLLLKIVPLKNYFKRKTVSRSRKSLLKFLPLRKLAEDIREEVLSDRFYMNIGNAAKIETGLLDAGEEVSRPEEVRITTIEKTKAHNLM